MQLFDYNEDECPWYYFDSSYKTLLGACLIIFGVFGVLLNAWLYVTFIHSHLVVFKSHVLVLNLCSASLGRNLLGFPFAGSSALAKRWLFGPSCCQLFAFLNQFFGVFQMIALFALVLERYLQAKYYKRERTVYFRYYWTLIGVCWMVAVVFATPPLFGYGMYSCDATGTVCTFLWPSLSSGAKGLGFSVPYVIVCGVLPIVGIILLSSTSEDFLCPTALLIGTWSLPRLLSFGCLPLASFGAGMSYYLLEMYSTFLKSITFHILSLRFFFMGKAIRLETIYYRSEQLREEKRLTKCIHAVCVTTLALWIPSAVLAGWQWFPLLLYGYRPHVPKVLALFAPIAAEAATSVPVLCYLSSDERIRAALLGRMRNHYALLHPERAKLYRRSHYSN